MHLPCISQACDNSRAQLLTDFSEHLRVEYPEVAHRASAIAALAADTGPGRSVGGAAPPHGYGFGGAELSYGGGFGYHQGGGNGGGATASYLPSGATGRSTIGGGGLADGDVADEVEQFEALEAEMVMASHPEALAFFNAGKLARPKGKGGGASHLRAKPRPFQ